MLSRLSKAAVRILGGLGLAASLLYLAVTRCDPGPSRQHNPLRPGGVVDEATLQRAARVILVTLDGARWQDVLNQSGALAPAGKRPVMPRALAASRATGVVLSGTTSSRVPLSLPGYQALAAGSPTGCEDNQCPRIGVETLAEGLARRLALPPEQSAVFGSWARLTRSASSRDGTVLVDLPPEGQNPGPPWPNARWDQQTLERAFAHLEAHRPRFLHLALLDMDERAHLGDAAGVVAALEAADAALGRLFDQLARLPAEERRLTTVLVTTDHGRGPGSLWSDHGPYAASRSIFLLAVGERVHGGDAPFTQADLRPTIERLFGLCPSPCVGEGCGKPIEAIVGGPAAGCEEAK